MNSKTYRDASGIGKTGQSLKEFGDRQNKLNAEMLEELKFLRTQNQALSGQLSAALERIAALEASMERMEREQELNIKRFGRCAADLDAVEKDIDRLKLTAKLNSNAIDRLTKK